MHKNTVPPSNEQSRSAVAQAQKENVIFIFHIPHPQIVGFWNYGIVECVRNFAMSNNSCIMRVFRDVTSSIALMTKQKAVSPYLARTSLGEVCR